MGAIINNLILGWHNLFPFVQVILLFGVLFFLLDFLIEFLKRKLVSRSSSIRQKKTILGLASFLRYLLVFMLIIFSFLSVSNSLKELGLTLGLLSAAIGFALQGPITGLAAWIMLIIKRPFEIGDRVTIGSVKGNVKEISMSHIYLEEVGRFGGESVSGRTVIIANGKLFSENIVNYSLTTDFLLGQVIFTITFESDMDEAIRLAMLAVVHHTDHFNKQAKQEPHVRMSFTANGMEIHARYFVPYQTAQVVSTKITHDLFNYIKQNKDVHLSYNQHSLYKIK